MTHWTSFSFVLIVIIIGIRFAINASRGETLRALVSGIVAAVYVFGMWVPGILQARGQSLSKDFASGLLSLPDGTEVHALTQRWSLELTVVLCAELLVSMLLDYRSRRVANERQRNKMAKSGAGFPRTAGNEIDSKKRIFWALLFVGAATTILLPAPDLSQRAAGGQGVENLLRTTLIVALAFAAYHRFFRSMPILLASVVFIAYLALADVRSPLLVVGLGGIAGWLSQRRRFRLRIVAIAVAGVLAFAILAAFMSYMRANVTRHEGLTSSQIIRETLRSPLPAIYESGLDTLDGYRLSAAIDPSEGSHLSDPLTIVTTFVPRSVWPSKPNDLTVEISAKYLHYGASGQFMSAVGYLRIFAGSYSGALVALLGVSALFAAAVQLSARSFGLTIVLVVLVRFFIGGAAFDVYYGLTLLVVYVVATVLFGRTRRPDNKRPEAGHSDRPAIDESASVKLC